MHTSQETTYTHIWSKVQELARKTQKSMPMNVSAEAKLQAHEKYVAEIKKLDLGQIERQHGISFRAWLINQFHQTPEILIKHLYCLQWARHSFQPQLIWEDSFIDQICKKPKAIEILSLVFTNLHAYTYQVTMQRPPFTIAELREDVFCYLLENHERYSQFYPPVFWTIIHNEIHLMEKILRVKPEWVNFKNSVGENPLMVAIQLKKDDAILKLLEFHPDINAVNQHGENIAHLACQSDDKDWLLKLIYDPDFSGLELAVMIADPEKEDMFHQIALNHAFLKGYTDFVKTTLEIFPHLKGQVYSAYYQAIERNNTELLDRLYDELDLKFDSVNALQVAYGLHAIQYHTDAAFNWLMDKPQIAPELKKALQFLNEIIKGNLTYLSTHLQSLAINWREVPDEVCFKISTMLLKKNQSEVIAHLGLFEFNPAFHSYVCHSTGEKNTLIDAIFVFKDLKLSALFVSYALAYLEDKKEEYPLWLGHFHTDIIKTLNTLGIEKNSVVHGEPLLHFLEKYCYQTQTPEKRQEILSAFITPSVVLNVKNHENKHLFAKLISESPQAYERIVMLRNLSSDFSLDNLDERGSNLLHLAVESSNLDCIRWGFNQNIDAFATRESDGMHAAQLILDSRNIEMFDILRKHIKKSAFLTFIQDLITQKKDELLDYLFSFERPFSWAFTEHHIKQLKTLLHPIIEKRFNPPEPKAAETTPEPVVVAVEVPKAKAPVPIALDYSILRSMIESQNQKRFELLLQEQYQETLRAIFSEHFFEIMTLVFRSDCKNLNKTFIRIPAAQESIVAHDAWHALLHEAISTGDFQIIENMLGRQAIVDQIQLHKVPSLRISDIRDIWHGLMMNAIITGNLELFDKLIKHGNLKDTYRSRKMDYYFEAMENHPLLWSQSLMRHFPVTEKEFKLLFAKACASKSHALHFFLSQASHRQLFLSAPLEFWFDLLSRDWGFMLHFLEHTELHEHLLSHARDFYLEALTRDRLDIANTLLAFPEIRQNFKAGGLAYLKYLMSNGLESKFLQTWYRHQELRILVSPYIKVKTVDLPQMIQDAFQLGFTGQDILFLVGSTIHHLIENKPLESLNDVDFVSTTQPHYIPSVPSSPRAPSPTLPCMPYKQSRVQPQIFFTTLGRTKIEYYVSATELTEEETKDQRNFIAETFSKRDFTVNSLYCDINGGIFDPCGLGMRDLKERRIRCIGNPVEAFSSDPIRILRAIRLMVKGFILENDVKDAIMSWQRPKSLNFAHLYAMTNQMLYGAYALMIFEILKEFNLLTKLLRYTGPDTGYSRIGLFQEFLNLELNRFKYGSPAPSPTQLGMK